MICTFVKSTTFLLRLIFKLSGNCFAEKSYVKVSYPTLETTSRRELYQGTLYNVNLPPASVTLPKPVLLMNTLQVEMGSALSASMMTPVMAFVCPLKPKFKSRKFKRRKSLMLQSYRLKLKSQKP